MLQSDESAHCLRNASTSRSASCMSSPNTLGFLDERSRLLNELGTTAYRQLRGGEIRTAEVGSGSARTCQRLRKQP